MSVDLVDLSVLAGLLAVSFLVSGSAAAVSSLDRADRQQMKASVRDAWIVDQLDATGLDTSLILAELVATVFTAAAGLRAFASFLPPIAAVPVVAIVLALVAKATGQALGASYRVRWTRAIAPLLGALHAISAPVRVPIVRVGDALARATAQSRPEQQADREAEILDLIHQGTKTGTVDARERDIVEAVFEFGEITVGRLMTPRPDMFAVPLDIAWDDLLARCHESGHARVPVYRGRVDDVIGVLLVKDLLKYRSQAPERPSLADLRGSFVPPAFVPQSKPANATLREFLAKNRHMAFVVDEHGTLVGLLTLDDLLSELVGEFLDYGDEPDDHSISMEKPGHFRVKAWLDLEDFREETGIDLPNDGYHTIGGFVFHVLGRLPHRGDTVTHGGNRYIVVAMEGRRIAEVQVEPVPEATAAKEAP